MRSSEPRLRPSSGSSSDGWITKQIRIEDSAIDIDPLSQRDAAAGCFLGEKGLANTASERDVTDEVVRYTHVAHTLLNDPLKGVGVTAGKILGVDRRVRLRGEHAPAEISILARHPYPRERLPRCSVPPKERNAERRFRRPLAALSARRSSYSPFSPGLPASFGGFFCSFSLLLDLLGILRGGVGGGESLRSR